MKNELSVVVSHPGREYKIVKDYILGVGERPEPFSSLNEAFDAHTRNLSEWSEMSHDLCRVWKLSNHQQFGGSPFEIERTDLCVTYRDPFSESDTYPNFLTELRSRVVFGDGYYSTRDYSLKRVEEIVALIRERGFDVKEPREDTHEAKAYHARNRLRTLELWEKKFGKENAEKYLSRPNPALQPHKTWTFNVSRGDDFRVEGIFGLNNKPHVIIGTFPPEPIIYDPNILIFESVDGERLELPATRINSQTLVIEDEEGVNYSRQRYSTSHFQAMSFDEDAGKFNRYLENYAQIYEAILNSICKERELNPSPSEINFNIKENSPRLLLSAPYF